MPAPARKPMALMGNRTAVPPLAAAPTPAPMPTRVARQANREGKRAVTVYVGDDTWEALRLLAIRLTRSRGQRATSQELMTEAIELLFQSHNVPPPISAIMDPEREGT